MAWTGVEAGRGLLDQFGDLAECAELFDSSFVEETFRSGITPERRLNLAEWCNLNVWLDSAGARQDGRYDMGRTPYLFEPAECMSSHSPIRRVVFMKGSQIGATQFGINAVGYYIDEHPCGILFLEPTVELAKRNSRAKLEPMIEKSPRLSQLIRTVDHKKAKSTLEKQFPGGYLILGGAKSSAAFRSIVYRLVVMDEVDEWDLDLNSQGDAVRQAERGAKTYPDRKVLIVSTPTIEGASRVSTEFRKTDQRFYFVPCVHCGHEQRLYWTRPNDGRKGVVWKDRDFTTAVYVCEKCDRPWQEEDKNTFLPAGKWRPTNSTSTDPLTRGFHLNALYSPMGFFSWADCVQQWLEAKDNPEELKVFVNQVLGETWKEAGDAPDWEDLFRRRESYRIGTVPRRGMVLTAGVDVQANRLEAEVVAWGPGMESWSIAYEVIPGDPAEQATWEALDRAILERRFPVAGGGFVSVQAVCVDRGFSTSNVYRYAIPRRTRVFPVKGMESQSNLLGAPKSASITLAGKKVLQGAQYWPVGTSELKSELYAWLRQRAPLHAGDPIPPGFCHFPEYGEEWFRGLVAEHRIVKKDKFGFPKRHWAKRHERNEPLDCRVYARAAAELMHLSHYTAETWQTVMDRANDAVAEDERGEGGAELEGAPVEMPTDTRSRPAPRPSTPTPKQPGGWLDGFDFSM